MRRIKAEVANSAGREKKENHFKKAIEIDPNRIEAYNNLGILYSISGEQEEAITVFKKAIEIINKEQSCLLARLCRDHITDEWMLTTYTKKAKTYSFTTYTWDPVDEKWKESFPSKPQPISKFEEHLKFTSAGKECKILLEF